MFNILTRQEIGSEVAIAQYSQDFPIVGSKFISFGDGGRIASGNDATLSGTLKFFHNAEAVHKEIRKIVFRTNTNYYYDSSKDDLSAAISVSATVYYTDGSTYYPSFSPSVRYNGSGLLVSRTSQIYTINSYWNYHPTTHFVTRSILLDASHALCVVFSPYCVCAEVVNIPDTRYVLLDFTIEADGETQTAVVPVLPGHFFILGYWASNSRRRYPTKQFDSAISLEPPTTGQNPEFITIQFTATTTPAYSNYQTSPFQAILSESEAIRGFASSKVEFVGGDYVRV